MNNNFYLGGLEALFGLGLAFILLFVAFFLVILVIYIVGRWKLYEKAGQEGWKSIIPFYNDWVYVEMAGLNSWYFLMLIATTISTIIGFDDDINVSMGVFKLISLVGVFFCNYNISKKIHKDLLFAILMTLFPYIVIPIVGLSNNISWDNNVEVSLNGPIDDMKNNNNNNNSNTYSNNSSNTYSNNSSNTYKEKINEEVKDEEGSQNHRFCGNCGAEIETGSKYCSNCGKEI